MVAVVTTDANSDLPIVSIGFSYRDVQRRGIPQYFYYGTLCRGCPYRWLPLSEIGDRVRARPRRAAQPTVEGDWHARGDHRGASLGALLCRGLDRHPQCQREKGPQPLNALHRLPL